MSQIRVNSYEERLQEFHRLCADYDLRYTAFVALGFDHVCSYYFSMMIHNWQLVNWLNHKNVFKKFDNTLLGEF